MLSGARIARYVLLVAVLAATPSLAHADDAPADDAPADDAPADDAPADDAPADDAPAADDDRRDTAAANAARAAHEAGMHRRLPRKLTLVIDAAFALYDLQGLRQALPEMWRDLRDDPDLRAIARNLAKQYTPRLAYAGYVGAVAQSERYGGLVVGFEADLVAPICRYVGGSFDAQLYSDGDDDGLAYNTRVTGCLPWGPFSLELGFISQRSARLGLAAAPVLPASRYDAQGFELRIRGFRWLDPRWEVVTLPADVVFVDRAPVTSDGFESVHFTVDSVAVRYIRYGAGPAGEDRVLEVVPVRVTGEQDSDGAMRSATVVEFGLLRFAGVRLVEGWYLDANATFQQGSLGATTAGAGRDATVVSGGVDTTVHLVRGSSRGYARYTRGLLPDAEFRILSDDRGELGASRSMGSATLSASTFAAYTHTMETPAGVLELQDAATYGASIEYGRPLYGPFYLTARGEAARSFYTAASDLAIEGPRRELRVTLGIAAGVTSDAAR